MTIELLLPLATPSQNAFHYSSRFKAIESKRVIALALLKAIRDSGGALSMKALGKRRLSIIRFGVRRCDVPNIVGGAKGLIDCLVKEGLLVDDDDEYLELGRIANGKLSKGQDPHTRVILSDIEGVGP